MTIILPVTQELLNGFGAVAPHMAGRTEPNLHCVRVTRWTISATCRYSAAMYEHTTYEESVQRYGEAGPSDPDMRVVIPANVVTEIVKHKIAKTGETLLILTHTSATFTVDAETVWQQAWIDTSKANYPPVERLFPDVTDLPIDYTPQHLGSGMLALVAKSGQALGKGTKQGPAALRFQYEQAPIGVAKARPVLVTSGRLSMIVQPVTPTGGAQ